MYNSHPLRLEAEKLCTGLRRSRGPELYIARDISGTSGLLSTFSAGNGSILILPSTEGIETMRSYLKGITSPDILYTRFENATYVDEDVYIICRGIKLLENPAELEIAVYDREVRRRCAYVLREDSSFGGGLDVCRMIIIILEGSKSK